MTMWFLFNSLGICESVAQIFVKMQLFCENANIFLYRIQSFQINLIPLYENLKKNSAKKYTEIKTRLY